MENYPIDIVVTWVDGNDPEWQKEKNKYSGKVGDSRAKRYRNWDNFQYWFRGIEYNAPWVNKIYLVTWGHIPEWLNVDNPKLVIVKHEDFIPKDFLPTFSCRAIEMNLHRIKGLSEHFVYFNDDMFLIGKTRREDFFVKGLPCDAAVMRPAGLEDHSGARKELPSEAYTAPIFNMLIINRYFNKRESIKKNWRKWYSIKYGTEAIKNVLLTPWNYFPGFQQYHLCYSYLKKTYEDVWALEGEALSDVCSHKFRVNTDYNQVLFSFWQLAKGEFYPRSPKFGKLGSMGSDQAKNEATLKALTSGRYKVVCVNDNVDGDNFEECKQKLNAALEMVLPNKSSYEK